MPTSLYLTHPDRPGDPFMCLIRPPRLRSDLRGDTFWALWWRTAILVQSSTTLPLPSMFAHDPHTHQGYLMQALLGGIAMPTSYLSFTNNISSDYTNAPPTLAPTLKDHTSSYTYAKTHPHISPISAYPWPSLKNMP